MLAEKFEYQMPNREGCVGCASTLGGVSRSGFTGSVTTPLGSWYVAVSGVGRVSKTRGVSRMGRSVPTTSPRHLERYARRMRCAIRIAISRACS